MSDVLGSIAKRLQTDLADVARASIDPNFSRALTADRFAEEDFNRRKKASDEQAALQRQQNREDQDRGIKLKMQFLAANTAIKSGEQTGDWRPLKKMVDSGNIDPLIAPELEMMATSNIPQGLEWALKQGDLLIKAENASQAKLGNMLRAKELDERTRNNIRTMFLKKQKFNFERAQADLDTAIANDDAEVVKNFFDTSPMLTDEERPEWQAALDGKVSGAQAINVMNKFLDEQRALNVQQAKNAEKAGQTPQDYKLYKDVRDDYQGVSKPLREELKLVADIKNLLEQEQDPITNKALTSKVSALFSSGMRAQAELNNWRTVGSLGQRVVNSFDEFFTGTKTESSLADIRKTVNNYKVDLERAHNIEKARAYDTLVEFGGGRQDPSRLFPDANTRFTKRLGKDGEEYIVDTWLKTFKKVGSAQ